MKLIDENLKEIFESQGISDFMSAYAYLKNTQCYSDLECLVNAFNQFELNPNDYDYVRIIEADYDAKRLSIQVSKLKQECAKLSEYVMHCAKMMVVHHELFDVVFEIRDINEADFTFIFQDFKGITQNLPYKDVDDKTESLRQEMYADGDDLPVEGVRDNRTIADLLSRVDFQARRYNRYGDLEDVSYADEISEDDVAGPEPERVESVTARMRRLIRDTDNYGTGGLRVDEERGEVDLNSWGEAEFDNTGPELETSVELPSGVSVNLNTLSNINTAGYYDFEQHGNTIQEMCNRLGIDTNDFTVNDYYRYTNGIVGDLP